MNIIEVTHLTREFGDIPAVDEISFGIAEGETFAVLGPHGAGSNFFTRIEV